MPGSKRKLKKIYAYFNPRTCRSNPKIQFSWAKHWLRHLAMWKYPDWFTNCTSAAPPAWQPIPIPFLETNKGNTIKGGTKRRSQPIIKGVLHHPTYTGTSSMDFFFRGWRLWHWVCLTVHITVIKPHITLISLMSSWYPELPMVKAHKSTMSFHISQH